MEIINNSGLKEETSFTDIISHYLKYWIYIVCSIIICVGLALLYLYLKKPEYKVSAKILMKTENKGFTFDLNDISNYDLSRKTNNIDDELEVLRSRSLLQRVADSLKLNIVYHKPGLKNTEIYTDSPFQLKVSNFKKNGILSITKQKDKFLLKDYDSDYSTPFVPGQPVDTPFGLITIVYKGDPTDKCEIKADIYASSALPLVDIRPVSKNSSVIELSMVSPVPEKSTDIINTLVKFYNFQALDEKNKLADQSIQFIDDRISLIASELSGVEKNVEQYKQSNRIADLQSEADLYLTTGGEYDKRIVDLDMQKQILQSVESYINNQSNQNNVIPSNIGISDPTLVSMIETFNAKQFERNRLASTARENNPVLKEHDSELSFMRNNILKNIKSIESGLQISLGELKVKERSFNSKIRNLSTQEREVRELSRQQGIKETLFLYLLQKREESALTLAMYSPNAKIIDKVYTDPVPVKPKKKVVLIFSLLAGIILPLLFIYLKDLLKFKISSREELDKLAQIPVLGEVPDGKDVYLKSAERSGVTEMYHMICTNLGFILAENENVIEITSTIPKEGKSSFSANLAFSLTTLGKKVILIDLDMRNSQYARIMDITVKHGMSSYLSDDSLRPEDVIVTSPFNKNLKLALAGPFPPNPIELLSRQRLDEFISLMKKEYDYVIIDTPPVSLVADALIINRISDLCIYVARAGFSHKSFIKQGNELFNKKKISKMCFVLKGIKVKKDYGYGYYNK